MSIPALLAPTGVLPLRMPSGLVIEVPKATPAFDRWSGPPPADTYNNKPVLDVGGRPAFAELAVLWALHAAGWDGVWIDTYSSAYRTGYWSCPVVPALPKESAELLGRIYESAGSRAGAWDVFCWRGPDVLFAECKRRGRDSIRASQERWLGGALGIGLPLRSFLVVEWSITEQSATADRPHN